ncbi:MAG TPA: hypothetical protein VFQ35_20895, partial [Polyangiaceae bacterium]|nr:hypothetical protein [Polyangiaceae bacterium]
LEQNRSEAPTAFTGAPIAMTGARFVAADSTGNVVNGPYGPVTLLDEDKHALALARVASVDFEINAGAFPDIEVRAAVLDANGAPINGLSAPDFALSDQGKPQGATLLSNTAVTDVRVLLAYDGSSSVTWPTPAAREAFDTSISQAFVDATTQAPFSLCVAGLGSASGPWSPPDATAIRNALSTLISSSPVWGTLGSAALAAGVSAVVVVSDFDADDDASTVSALRQRLGASGLAVALVPVGNANQATIAAVVEACGALVLDPNANDFPAQLAAFVSRRTLEIRSAAYRLRYRLPDDAASAAAARTVTLTCGAQPLTQSHDYVAPATGKAGLPPGIGGLYLEVTANGATSTRRLSGPRLTRFGVPERPFSAEDIAETKHLLSGLVAIAFEPGSPTTAANLEDVLSGVLSTEPASKAVGKDASAVAEAGAHFQFASGSLGMLAERAPSNARAAVPSGVRVVIQTMFVDEGGLARRFDIVPAANRVLGVGTDEAAAFRAAVVASVVPSQREASVSPGSAYARLATAELRFVAAFENPQALEGFTPADLAAWRSVLDQYGDWHRLVPTSPSVGALWVVDPDTGTSVAVLLDGSGGASHSCTDAVNNAVVQAALQVVSLYATYKSFVCELAQTGGTLPCVGATVATVYAAGAALFTAAVLDSVSYADVVLLLIGMVTTQFPAAYGGLLSLASLYVAKQEVADSLYEHC